MKEQATEDVLCDRLIMWFNRDPFLYSPLQESKPQLLDGPPRCAEWLLEHIRPGLHGLGPIGFWDYFKVGSLTGVFPKGLEDVANLRSQHGTPCELQSIFPTQFNRHEFLLRDYHELQEGKKRSDLYQQ